MGMESWLVKMVLVANRNPPCHTGPNIICYIEPGRQWLMQLPTALTQGTYGEADLGWRDLLCEKLLLQVANPLSPSLRELVAVNGGLS
jgi:hypothetical protein